MKKKKVLSIVLAAAMIAGLTAGCGSDSGSGEGSSEEAKGKVYYLNFKPEADEYWQELAETYTDETGVPVTVLTAASGEYEKTLKSEMAKTDAPTLFQVNGPVGLASWKDYCYDLSDSDIAGELTDDSFALMDGDKMAGIAYVVENYGIIYNKALLEQAGYTADDITDFDSFKEVVEDITARKDELGFSAFTSAGMDGSSDWRFKTHLANLPIYYEYKDEGIDTTDAIKGTYLDNYRQIWDLYINNATCAPTEISTGGRRDGRVRDRGSGILPERHMGIQQHCGRRRRESGDPPNLHRRGRRREPGCVHRNRKLLVRKLQGVRG